MQGEAMSIRDGDQWDETTKPGSSIQVLKIIVIVGGIGLLVGFLMLFMQMQQRGQERRQADARAPKEHALPLPAGGKVSAMIPLGSGAALLVEAPGTAQELLLMDREGTLTRRVRLTPVPP